MIEQHLLDTWYAYAARQPGFLGKALQFHREQAGMTQEQQRILLGIQDEIYDHLWLHLQAMLLPRPDQFLADLERIIAKVIRDEGIVRTIALEPLKAVLCLEHPEMTETLGEA